MVKSAHFSLAIVIFLLTFIIGTWSMVHANPGSFELTAVDEKEIKNVVEAYFKFRYHLLSNLQLGEFKNLADEFTQSDPFLLSEFDKLEVEMQHAKQYHLRYSQYKYFLDFQEISIDPLSLMATISVN